MSIMLNQHLEKLRLFHAVAREGSLIKASKEAGVSQPAISKALQILESAVGEQLVVRGRDGIKLTRAGTKLASFCEMLQARLADLNESLKSESEISGVFNIGTYETLAEIIWPKVLKALAIKCPNLLLRIETESFQNIFEKLKNGSLDMIVDAEPNTNEQLFSQVLYRDKFGIYKKKGSPFKESDASIPFSYVRHACDREGLRIADHLNKTGLKHSLTFDVQTFTFVRSLTVSGLCVGVLPTRLAKNNSDLVPLMVDGKPIEFGDHRICATYASHMKGNPRIVTITQTIKAMLML